jgi:hypothetical protein
VTDEIMIAKGARHCGAARFDDQEGFMNEKPDFYNLAGEYPRLTGAEAIARFQDNNEQKEDA